MPFPGSPYDPTATMVAADQIAFRGLSSRLWRFATQGTAHTNPGYGQFYLDDFHDLPASVENAAAGTALTSGARSIDASTSGDGALDPVSSIVGAVGTVGSLDTESTTADRAVAIAYPGLLTLPTDGYELVFEARIAVNNTGSLPNLFIGFHEDNKAAISSGSITASKDYFGVFSEFDEEGVLQAGISDGTTAAVTTNTAGATTSLMHTFVSQATAADGKDWVKVGGKMSGTANVNEFYVNGVLVAETLTQTLGPNQAVQPVIEVATEATTAGVLLIDWFAVGILPVGNA